MNYTKEQEQAIFLRGKNIMVDLIKSTFYCK